MELLTFGQIKDKVKRDLGIEQETFVDDTELMGYCNDAINEAEAEITTIYEDYFLTTEFLSIVNGTAEYSLPTKIYATKIREVVWDDSVDFYPIKRAKGKYKFTEIAQSDFNDDGSEYKYILVNDSVSTGIKLRLIPAAKETKANCIHVWYLRNANKITTDADYCDIPEFYSFVIQYMKKRIYEKEGHPNLMVASNDLEMLRKQMIETLTNMVPDDDTELEQDTTFYEETV